MIDKWLGVGFSKIKEIDERVDKRFMVKKFLNPEFCVMKIKKNHQISKETSQKLLNLIFLFRLEDVSQIFFDP